MNTMTGLVRYERMVNAWHLYVGGLHLAVWPGMRCRNGWEWHNHAGVRYLHVRLGNPRVHRRWAFSAYLYLPQR